MCVTKWLLRKWLKVVDFALRFGTSRTGARREKTYFDFLTVLHVTDWSWQFVDWLLIAPEKTKCFLRHTFRRLSSGAMLLPEFCSNICFDYLIFIWPTAGGSRNRSLYDSVLMIHRRWPLSLSLITVNIWSGKSLSFRSNGDEKRSSAELWGGGSFGRAGLGARSFFWSEERFGGRQKEDTHERPWTGELHQLINLQFQHFSKQFAKLIFVKTKTEF